MPRRVKNIRRKYGKKRSAWRNRATGKGPNMSRVPKRENQLDTRKKPLSNNSGIIYASRMWNIGSCVPAKMRAVHQYSEYITIGIGGVSPNTTIGTMVYYRLNSLYQPYFTSTAQQHQPYHYDQMRSLYNRSVVYAARVEVRIGASTEQQAALLTLVKNGTDVANPTGEQLYQWEEKPNAWIMQSQSTTNSYVPTRTFYFDIAEMFGITRNQLISENDYESTGNNNPASSMLIGFGCGNYSGLVGQLGVLVRITYYAQWSEPVVNPSS